MRENHLTHRRREKFSTLRLSLRLPDNTNGNAPVVLRTTDGATSRSDVLIRVN
ncbi:MAG TPA: hypothetical protein VGB76_14325 [Pyrinomonadaceae bacterium]